MRPERSTRTLSVVIITRNEAAKIRRCLQSVSWADELIVVDSGSTDGTVQICREFTPKVYVREFDTFDRQKNFGLEHATQRWILSVDADEVVSPALREALRVTLACDGGGCHGFVLRRQNHLCGHPIRYVWGCDALVRLVRSGCGRFHGEVHEKLVVDGPVGELTPPLLHFNSDDFHEYMAKNKQYIMLEARARYRKGERFDMIRLLLSPLRVFFFRYIQLRGFRDGAVGFLLCVLLGYFTFRLHAKLWQVTRSDRQR